jgi:hypothetical protein
VNGGGQGQERVALDLVDLVDHQDRPTLPLGKRIEQRFRVSLDAALGVDQHQHQIAVLGAAPGSRHHRPVEPALRREDPRRVDEHDLGPVVNGNAAHDRPCRLHLVRDDRDLGADKLVHQGRLARVGSADQRHEAGAGRALRFRRACICFRCISHHLFLHLPARRLHVPGVWSPRPVRLRAWNG